jgi:hypothetical protein
MMPDFMLILKVQALTWSASEEGAGRRTAGDEESRGSGKEVKATSLYSQSGGVG